MFALRRVALAALGQVAKHEQGLAETVHKEGATAAALSFLTHKDDLLRRQACRLLAVAIQHHDGGVEWVPSAANISDLPSRGAYDEYFAALPGSIRVPFVLPNFSTFTGPLAGLLVAFEEFF